MTVIYRRYRTGRAGAQLVMVEQDGEVLGPLPHVVRHSPDGLSWGYAGSGPADLARSLLLHALGADARCTPCRGSGRVAYPAQDDVDAEPYDPALHGDGSSPSPWYLDACVDCDGGYRHVPYQSFKFTVVAHLAHDEWSLDAEDIRSWLAAQREPGNAP